jgi:carboxypeptidase Taq
MTEHHRPPAYDRLTDRFVRIATIGEAGAVLGWDAATMMPPGGGAARGDQLAVLAGLAHGMLARRQFAPDAVRPHARDGAAGGPGGSPGARQLSL